MDDLATILVAIGMLSAVVFLGFLIVFIVGLVIKKKAPKTVGKLGMIFSAVFVLIGFGGGQIAANKYNQQQAKEEAIEKAEIKKENKSFDKACSDMTSKIYSIVSTAETTAQSINDGWGDAIDASSDEFDVTTVVQGLVDKNSNSISDMQANLMLAKEDLSVMEKNDTKTYDYAFYEKLYKHTSKLVDFVASPTGNYTNYIATFNERHQKIDDDLAELD